MASNINEVLMKYIRKMDGSRFFLGDSSVKEDLDATMILAGACRHYCEDVDEELYLEETLSCYNCRYRRWARSGFSCYKDFPIS